MSSAEQDSSFDENFDDKRLEEQFFKDDPISARFANELQQLTKDLEGNPEKAMEYMNQILGEDQSGMMDAIQKLRYVSQKRFEYSPWRAFAVVTE